MRIALGAVAMLMTGCFLPTIDIPIGSTDGGSDGGVVVKPLKPNLMFLVDKSGSMNFAADDSVSPCTPGCNTSGFPACAAGCRTRLQELKAAMNTFLSSTLPDAGQIGWMGMAIFPTAVAGATGVVDACGATTNADIRVPLSPDKFDEPMQMASAAAAVNTQIQALNVGGGTPTGGSLEFLYDYPPLADPDPAFPREDYVVLITDGVPNCNLANVNNCNNVAACKCTLIPASSCMPASFCVQGCLDADGTVFQITELRKKLIKTIVIGFGAEVAAGDGPATLQAMAEAGGFARSCPAGTDAECGVNNTCNTVTRLCTRAYLQATSAAELAAAFGYVVKALP